MDHELALMVVNKLGQRSARLYRIIRRARCCLEYDEQTPKVKSRAKTHVWHFRRT